MTESAKIVPFGKYKGQPVEAMVQDKSYTDWLQTQGWFKDRYQPIYNVVVNNFGAPSETPEHNALQALFLEEAFGLAFALATESKFRWLIGSVNGGHNRIVEHLRQKSDEEARQVSYYLHTQPYRGEADADFAIRVATNERTADKHLRNAAIYAALLDGVNEWAKAPTYMYDVAADFEVKGVDVEMDVHATACYPQEVLTVKAPNDSEYWQQNARPVLTAPRDHTTFKIEIKPNVSDDYPAVLRQMKHNGSEFLFVDSADPRGVTVDQMRSIFRASGFRIVFRAEVDAMLDKARLLLPDDE